jgi:hypothetical protein
VRRRAANPEDKGIPIPGSQDAQRKMNLLKWIKLFGRYLNEGFSVAEKWARSCRWRLTPEIAILMN